MTGISGPQPGLAADRAPAVTGKPLSWLRLDGIVLLAAALILFAAHIGMDRLARYGLKYDNSFQHTHLGGPRPREIEGAR